MGKNTFGYEDEWQENLYATDCGYVIEVLPESEEELQSILKCI